MIKMDLNSIRREYKFSGLRRNEVNKNPVKQFEKWFEEVMKRESMALTVPE